MGSVKGGNTQCGINHYADDIETYFTPYSDSALFDYVRAIRKESGIGYDAIPSIASMLEIENGRIKLMSNIIYPMFQREIPVGAESNSDSFKNCLMSFIRIATFESSSTLMFHYMKARKNTWTNNSPK